MALWDNINKISGSENKTFLKEKKYNPAVKKLDCNGSDIILTRKGIKVSMYLLKDLNIKRKLTSYFTVNIPTLMNYNIKVTNYVSDINNSKYIFPRFGFIKYMEENLKNYNFINNIGLGKTPSVPFKWTGKFKNNQPIIAEHIISNIFNKKKSKMGKSGLILNLNAGQGKSFLATGLMEILQRKTLVICHNKTIMYQWLDILKKAYPKNKVACYYGEKKENGDIVVGIINSLLLNKMYIGKKEVTPQTFYKNFGYVILDEVHEYVAKYRKKIYELCQSTYMLGLTATPNERSDGLDVVNTWQCGDVLNASELPGYTEDDIPFKGEVTMVKYKGSPDFTKIITNKTLDIISFSEMVSQICDDYYRTHLIVKLVFELRKENKNIFVFADRRSYLEKIRLELERFHITNDIWENDIKDTTLEAKRLVGGATAEEIKHAEEFSNVILTTYQFMGTGKSIPKMDSIILTTPRKRKSKQYVGRIFRLGSNYNSVRKIIDIVDWNTPMKSQWYKRKTFYDEMEYPISVKEIEYNKLEDEMIKMGILHYEDSASDNDIIEKTLQQLEKLIEKNNILDLELDEIELLNEYSSNDDGDIISDNDILFE